MKERLLSKQIRFLNKSFKIMLRPDADESVVAEIFDWREYRAAEEIIRESDRPLLDVGAHIGIFSLYASALNPALKIYALEPEDDNFALLQNNVAASGIKNIKVCKGALAGKSGGRNLILEPDSINHHLAPTEEGGEDAGRLKVQAYSVGEFFARNNISGIGLMKMDIEGGEYEVFEGMTSEDFAKVQNVILEYHNYNGRHYKELEKLLRQNGFSVQIFPSKFEKDMGFMLARNKRVSTDNS